jgi:hypothetical protein
MPGPVGRRVYATDPSKRRSPTKAKAKPKTPRTIDMRSITEGPGGGVRAGVRIVGMAAAKSGVKEAAKSLAKKVATKAQLIGGSGKKAVMIAPTSPWKTPLKRKSRDLWKNPPEVKKTLGLNGRRKPSGMPIELVKGARKKPAPLGYLKKELPKATHPSTSVGQAFSKRIGFRAREK